MFLIKSPNPHKSSTIFNQHLSEQQVVVPGETITTDSIFMRGHGTINGKEGQLIASVAGVVDKVNKLISVKPLKSRYQGEIGDVVIGRITDIGPSRWKADINSRQDAILLLSSVTLPGGVQRRKSESDALQMRNFFTTGELFSAEVQQFFHDGAASLHTRNIKYGKLRNGSLVIVPAPLVKRSKSHLVSLPFGVDLVLELNGYIWVAKHVTVTPEQELEPDSLYSTENEDISDTMRETIARVCNCITLLAKFNFQITDTLIVLTYDFALQYGVRDILVDECAEQIANAVKNQMDVMNMVE